MDAVVPHGEATPPRFVSNRKTQPQLERAALSKLTIAGALYNWATLVFIATMVVSQLLGVVWNTIETDLHIIDGRDPRLGVQTLDGVDREPFADRALACVDEERYYKPMQLSALLASGAAQVADTTGATVDAYRLVERSDTTALHEATLDAYTDVCALIATTMGAIFDACAALEYNVTQDSLRVVYGVASATTHEISNALPVVVLPLADNSLDARFAIPSVDGSACVFQLAGKYVDKSKTAGVLRGVARSVREAKTAVWLGQPDGVWRNGWYEDQVGTKWHADMLSSNQTSALGVAQRQFDTLKHKELDCARTLECDDAAVVETWGSKLTTTIVSRAETTVSVSDGAGAGLFFHEQIQHRTIQSIYDWETLISNISLSMLVVRWLFALYALQRGYVRGESAWYNAGIGCLASSRSFNMLPIVLLPRLKITLAAFWSVGCEFDGAQRALSEAWFIVYPAILELLLLQFSVLNILAKILRRRIPDAPFGPSVLLFCVLHWLRTDIATSNAGFGISGRVTPLLTSAEFETLSLADLFTTTAPLRLNGSITSLIAIKCVVLGLNFAPLLFAKSSSGALNGSNGEHVDAIGIERALAIRWCKVGGLGKALARTAVAKRNDKTIHVINSYELVRLGYLVYGSAYLISFDDWVSLAFAAPFTRFYHLWNNRVTLFTLLDGSDNDDDNGAMVVSEKPRMSRLDDPKLRDLRWWHVVGRPVK